MNRSNFYDHHSVVSQYHHWTKLDSGTLPETNTALENRPSPKGTFIFHSANHPLSGATDDGSEIPNNHLECINLNGINYLAIGEPDFFQ